MYIDIGRRIRRQRIKLKLTQEQLAEMAQISLSFMGHIERGTRALSVDTLCRIARALNCSTDALLGLDFSDSSGAAGEELADIIAQLQKIRNRFI